MSDFNKAVIICGPPGCGKTTLARSLVHAHLAQPSAVVFAHDPVQQYRGHCIAMRDPDEWRNRARAWKEGEPGMPRAVSFTTTDAEAVTALALEIGKRTNHAERVRCPMLVVYDEASLLATSGSTYMGPLDNELLSTRRHRGVGPVFCIQQPSQLTSRFFEFSTDVALFRQTEDRARALEGLLLLNRGELSGAGVATLPDFCYLHVRPGKGIVEEPLT